MAKYIYVGDPALDPKTGKPLGPCKEGAITIRKGVSEVSFQVGQPTEVPESMLSCVEKNNHFKLVDAEKPVDAAATKEPAKDVAKK